MTSWQNSCDYANIYFQMTFSVSLLSSLPTLPANLPYILYLVFVFNTVRFDWQEQSYTLSSPIGSDKKAKGHMLVKVKFPRLAMARKFSLSVVHTHSKKVFAF